MPLSEHDRKTVAAFFTAIEPQIAAYHNGSFAYLAVKREGRFALVRGVVHLRPISDASFTHFASDNIRAGHCRLAELKASPQTLIDTVLAGKIITPGCDIEFPPSPQNAAGYNVWHSSFHPVGLQTNKHISVLGIAGADNFPHDRMAELDWELKAAAIPYDGLPELMRDYSLGTLQTFGASGVEIIAAPVAEIDAASRIEGRKATLRVRLAGELATDQCALGYRAVSCGKAIARARLDGGALRWTRAADGWEGVAEIDLAEPAVLHCTVSYHGSGQHTAWLSDSSTAQNTRRAAYESFDRGLAVLKEIIAREPDASNSRDARDFETAVSWLFWMMGFSAVHLGATRGTQKAADLLAATPAGHVTVIECTLGLLKADKLAMLHDRAQAVRRDLEAAGSRQLRVLAIAVTSQPLADVEPDLDAAAKRQIFVITREGIKGLIGNTLAAPDADRFFEEAEQGLKFALAKPDLDNPLGFTEPL